MKIFALEVLEDVWFPKLGIAATTTLSDIKQPGIKLTLGKGVVLVERNGETGIVPLHNIRQATLFKAE